MISKPVMYGIRSPKYYCKDSRIKRRILGFSGIYEVLIYRSVSIHANRRRYSYVKSSIKEDKVFAINRSLSYGQTINEHSMRLKNDTNNY